MGKKRISVPQESAQERGYYTKAGGLLKSAATGLSAGAYQQNMLAPYLYNLAGLDVQYDDRSGDLQAANTARDQALSSLTDLQGTRGSPAARKALLAQLQSDPAFAAALNKKGSLKGAKLRGY